MAVETVRKHLAESAHKAKEEGKAELLKQMMEVSMEMRAAAVNVEDPAFGEPPLYEKIWLAMLRTFATEQGINIEKGEG